MKFTIGLPITKTRFLKESLDSMDSQTFKDFEWIIVDDNSDLKNKAFYKEIKETAPFDVVIIENEVNLRQAKAKNIGFSAAKGKYIKFIDADDLIDNFHLENQYKIMTNRKTENSAVFSPTFNFFVSKDLGKLMSEWENE
jgi:glycosyltransferase involved in cell wall biosynthesis